MDVNDNRIQSLSTLKDSLKSNDAAVLFSVVNELATVCKLDSYSNLFSDVSYIYINDYQSMSQAFYLD